MFESNFLAEAHEMTLDEVKTELKEYERLYGMTSDEFYEKWKRGETDWVSESVDWSGLVRAYRVMNGKVGSISLSSIQFICTLF